MEAIVYGTIELQKEKKKVTANNAMFPFHNRDAIYLYTTGICTLNYKLLIISHILRFL